MLPALEAAQLSSVVSRNSWRGGKGGAPAGSSRYPCPSCRAADRGLHGAACGEDSGLLLAAGKAASSALLGENHAPGPRAPSRRAQSPAVLQHVWCTRVTRCSHACLLLPRVPLTAYPQPSPRDLAGNVSGVSPRGCPAPSLPPPVTAASEGEVIVFFLSAAGTVPRLRRMASWARLSQVTVSPPSMAATEAGRLLKTTPGTVAWPLGDKAVNGKLNYVRATGSWTFCPEFAP